MFWGPIKMHCLFTKNVAFNRNVKTQKNVVTDVKVLLGVDEINRHLPTVIPK